MSLNYLIYSLFQSSLSYPLYIWRVFYVYLQEREKCLQQGEQKLQDRQREADAALERRVATEEAESAAVLAELRRLEGRLTESRKQLSGLQGEQEAARAALKQLKREVRYKRALL